MDRAERARTERSIRSWMRTRREQLAERVDLASDRADTLIEVLVSSLVIAVMILGTFNGLDATNRAAALGRARSQAQALAEKDEERLRGEPISALAKLNGEEKAFTAKVEGTAVKTTYTIKSSVNYINEKGVSDCAAEASEGYYKTKSEVSWTGMRSSKEAVVETGSISPPAGATLIVRVEGSEKGAGVPGMTVYATGPEATGTAYQEETTSEGCALFGPFEEGGEYIVNVKRTGYVDQNWYSEVKEDPEAKTAWNLLLNVATKAAYRFAPAGTLKANLTTISPSECSEKCTWAETKAQNLMVSNSEGMHPENRTLFKTSSLRASPFSSESPGVFPFPTPYAVYASNGLCETDNPTKFGTAKDPEVQVPANGTGEVEVPVPAMIVRVWGKSTETTEPIREPSKINKIVVKDTGCNTASQSQTLLSASPIPEKEFKEKGVLKSPGMPYGTYTVCNEWVEGGKTESTEITKDENPEETEGHRVNYDMVNLFRGAKHEKACPS
jgi:Tfp pilus assembly protein PilV